MFTPWLNPPLFVPQKIGGVLLLESLISDGCLMRVSIFRTELPLLLHAPKRNMHVHILQKGVGMHNY